MPAILRASKQTSQLRRTVKGMGVLAVGLVTGCHLQLFSPPCNATTLVSLRVQPATPAIMVGEQVTLTAIGQYQGTTSAGDVCDLERVAGDLSWRTSDSTIARVTLTYDSKANVEGVRSGRVEITAATAGAQASALVQVALPTP